MKKCFLLCLLFFFLNVKINAQTYVTIPDANFVTWLQTNYPSCMNGNQMNIECAGIQSVTYLDIHFTNISDLTGIEHFVNLDTLLFSNNLITSLPVLPSSLSFLSCQNNQLTHISNLPNSLKWLFCHENSITNIDFLPDGLKHLGCGLNLLTSLPTLPNSLVGLSCIQNNLTTLPDLPDSLFGLECSYNNLTNLPNLPNTLYQFLANFCNLSTLPSLPDSLRHLEVEYNNLTSLPNLPNKLELLACGHNNLTTLPDLPLTLTGLDFSHNLISSISYLPDLINNFGCSNNLLTSLPELPNSLNSLVCDSNQLTYLPYLGPGINVLHCQNNNISCLPYFFDNYYDTSVFKIFGNPFTCLPNYISVMDSYTLGLPLCLDGDTLYNPNECPSTKGILGEVFYDINNDCTFNNFDYKLHNIALKQYNAFDSLLGQIRSLPNGFFQFLVDTGAYKVKIDTLNMPFTVQCQNLDTSIILTSQNPLADSVNFALICKPGFDIGVQSVLTNGWVFPGQNHEVKILAGDMSQWYNMACASGVTGEVQVSVSGPVSFQNNVSGTLTPTVSGNSFTYTISDFGSLDFSNSFGLVFKTDTTAQVGDEICVSVDATPSFGDNNMNNNHYEFCYSVVNSYDPNMKEVYPINVEPGFEDYFTYTIHFQNTGSAPAFNIRLLDTLDVNLDLETFQVLNYSHYNTTMVKNNVLTFHFPNIMLADSTSDLEASKGYVQYRIKPKANLALGTEIKNTANIYFDFNDPIVTNTTLNRYVEENTIKEVEKLNVKVYPNPFNHQTTIEFSKAMVSSQIKIYNIFGQEVFMSSKVNGNKLIIDRGNHPNGVYFVKVISNKIESQILKLIVKD